MSKVELKIGFGSGFSGNILSYLVRNTLEMKKMAYTSNQIIFSLILYAKSTCAVSGWLMRDVRCCVYRCDRNARSSNEVLSALHFLKIIAIALYLSKNEYICIFTCNRASV